MFISYFIFALATYTVYSFNLSCLTYLIEDGYFDHPFWTRSLRAAFLAPPFAILIVAIIIAKDSVKSNIKNIGIVMKKRD
jgi:hypothetical protein